ncbi:MAG TPA: hypothetical protein VFK48_18905 [Usitatibacter sp.]|nr:hypothetical protein [Usitatibacter sp.]
MQPENSPPDAGRALREIPVARQNPGEPRRRWFTSSGMDLFVWVDGGESRPARYKGSPILVADGVVDTHRILEEFRREAGSLPAEIVRMVEARVAELAG